jgi:hypothetical protein
VLRELNQTAEMPIAPVVAQLRIPARNLRDDHDGDGLKTRIELLLGTDPLAYDTDHDGLSDGFEVRRSGTNPLDPDTDDDRVGDGDAFRRSKAANRPTPTMGRRGGTND